MTTAQSTPRPTLVKLDRAPTYDEFYESYLLPNRPVIIGPDLVKDWDALQRWALPLPEPSQETSRREINWSYLADTYGDQEVSVSDCQSRDSFGNLECESASFRSVIEQWQNCEGQSLYVKDWHLARSAERPPANTDDSPDRPFYITPNIFKDDWMNAYYISHTSDDFRFVYVGAAGTYTPLHRDVYCSYSWSTNVCGRKRWWLFPPEQTHLLFMKERNVCVHDVQDVDPAKFPDYAKATPLIVEQGEGETIFVPSGWYHQVENLTACISINHNWCNSVNLPMLYSSMCDKVVEVEKALDDVRQLLRQSHQDDEKTWKAEFCTVVQQLVEQDAGWNWLTFWRMVKHALLGVALQEGLISVAEDASASNEPLPSQPIFPCAPPHLRPPFALIRDRIRTCHDHFVQRDRLECEGDVKIVVQEVAKLLNVY